MNSRTKSPPIICADDAWFMIAAEPPLTADTLRNKLVPLYADTPAAYWWAVGDHEVYHHETAIGEIFGEGLDDLKAVERWHSMHSEGPGGAARTAGNIRSLSETAGGPLAAHHAAFREAGIEFFPRVRMNSHYDIPPSSPSYGRYRHEHPELLIGRPGEVLPEGTIEWAISTGLDYAHLPVREYMYSIIVELFERFDIDGVELDFMRHPAFFRTEEAWRNGYLMTDLVRSVRTRMTEVGNARGKSIRLAVRVPPTLVDSRRAGLEVAAWVAEDLVDVVVVVGGFIPFDTPVAEFTAVARDTQTQVYGAIEALRHMDEEYLRALASLFWKDGADGVYLYNYFTMPADWNKRVLNHLADPEALKRLDKRYQLGSTGPYFPTSGHSAAFRFASPSTQLPLTLHQTLSSTKAVLGIRIADDIQAAAREGLLGTCTLLLQFESFADGDRLDLAINGEPFSWSAASVSHQGWSRQERSPSAEYSITPSYPVERHHPGVCVEYEVNYPPLVEGDNRVEVALVSDRAVEDPSVELVGMEVSITYRA